MLAYQDQFRGPQGLQEPSWPPGPSVDRGFPEPTQPSRWPPSMDQGMQNPMQQSQWPNPGAFGAPNPGLFGADQSLLGPPPQSSPPLGLYENNSLLAQAMQMQQALGEAGNAAINQMQMSAMRSMQPSQGINMSQPLSPMGGSAPQLYDGMAQFQQPTSPGMYGGAQPSSPLRDQFAPFGSGGASYVGQQIFNPPPIMPGSYMPPSGSYMPPVSGPSYVGSTAGAPGMQCNNYPAYPRMQ